MIDPSRSFRHVCTLFPGIGSKGRVVIPQERHSAIEVAGGLRAVSWGALEAACQILLGRAQVRRDQDSVTLAMIGTQGQPIYSRASRQNSQITWVNPGRTVRPYALLIAEALLFGIHSELKERWEELVQELASVFPTMKIGEQALAKASQDETVKGLMYAVVDTLYFTAKVNRDRGEIDEPIPVPTSWPHTPVLLGLKVAQALTSTGTVSLTPEARLARRAPRGLRALLYGPTGTGKTEMAKRVMLQMGARMVDIKGRPGLEDRDMVGFFAPTEAGPAWVDGAVARAMRLAQGGVRVGLIVDELMRFEPHHRNLFVGLMDDKSAEELRALLGLDLPDGRYYTLDLPGKSEVLYAPVSHLSVLCTTNIGARYTQSGELDPALKRRFQLLLEVTYPDEADILPVYEKVAGVQAARVAYDLEVATRTMTLADGQLLTDPMNIGVTLNYLSEVGALLACGLSLAVALQEALTATLAPFCCAFGDDGLLDAAGVKSLQTTLAGLLREAGLS